MTKTELDFIRAYGGQLAIGAVRMLPNMSSTEREILEQAITNIPEAIADQMEAFEQCKTCEKGCKGV